MKTASRILGTAAFLEGFRVQDSPLYGAERRGAPITAFTRINDHPILERGIITAPDLVLVADETLLEDPLANPFLGLHAGSLLFINSPTSAQAMAEAVAARHPTPARILMGDLTALTLEKIGKAQALSATVGAAACKLAGVIGMGALEKATRKELEELGLPSSLIDRNLEAALLAFEQTPRVPLTPAPPQPAPLQGLVVPVYQPPARGTPSVAAPGNIVMRKTGGWRIFRPVIEYDKCNQCWICFVRCPEGDISLDEQENPHIDYDHCKGCLICVEECPTKAVVKEREVHAW